MHYWGDDDFDWNGLNEAIDFITKHLRRWRMGVHSKEKYGCADISVGFGIRSLHELIWPGYVWRQWPRNKLGDLLWHADIYWWPTLFAPLNRWVVVPLHKRAYRAAYRQATQRWPHLISEVAGSADYPDLLDKQGLPR
jgi:hypothetical protein